MLRATVVGLLWFGLAVAVRAAAATASDPGAAIYLQGVLTTGEPLAGVREAGGPRVKGMDAACVNCHHRSGLGTTEGRVTIPPITGQYLFHPRSATRDDLALPYVQSAHGNRNPYTDATLARSIRQGIDSEGRPLGFLMPRFALGDADMAALIGYLKKLDSPQVPGVTATVLHFATIVTPDADPVKRSGMLDVLQHYFADKNAFPFGPSPPMRSSGKTLYSKSMYMANRRWQLHVWELTGPAAGWRAQLERHLAQEPVMAVVSGLGGSNWAPVHEFCEQERLPCLFPSVEVPVVARREFYSLYFSQGVLLEAGLLAGRIAAPAGSSPVAQSVDQVYRADDSGEPAARALVAALKVRGVAVHDHPIAAGAGETGLAEALHAAAAADVLVLWLRPSDLAMLGEVPVAPRAVFVSGLMGGLEGAPLPPAWRARTQLTYPFDLPDRRGVRVTYPLEWFSIRHIPVVAEQVQIDTYLACGLLAETLSHMADVFARDYLVERMEEMLEHRLMTGYYPRLTLAEGQRFASKGGYVVRFASAAGNLLLADSDWMVP